MGEGRPATKLQSTCCELVTGWESPKGPGTVAFVGCTHAPAGLGATGCLLLLPFWMNNYELPAGRLTRSVWNLAQTVGFSLIVEKDAEGDRGYGDACRVLGSSSKTPAETVWRNTLGDRLPKDLRPFETDAQESANLSTWTKT